MGWTLPLAWLLRCALMMLAARITCAQDSWRNFTSANSGLTIDALSSLAVDSTGGLWAAGHYEGVDHFDGTAWHHLAGRSWVQSMTVDHYGKLWAFVNGSLWGLADSGLAEVDPNGFNEVFHIAADSKGAIWGVVDPAVFPGDLQNVTVIIYTNGRWSGIAVPFSRGLSAFAIEGNGASWVGTSDSGAIRLVGQTATLFTARKGGLPSDTVTAIEAVAGGDVWIGTAAGLAHYHGGQLTAVGTGLEEPSIRSIASDRSGGLWVTTGGFQRTGRLLHFDGTSWSSVENPPFAPAGFSRIAVDRSGRVWCIHADGLALYTPAPSAVGSDGMAGSDAAMMVSVRPNPFVDGVEIALPASSHAVADVVDVMGRTVRVLTDRDRSSGASSLFWDGRRADGSRVPDGIYICRVYTARGVVVARMMKLGGTAR